MTKFDLSTVHAGLAGTRFAEKVRHFPSVGSTNQLAIDAAQAGEVCGVWVADEQTAGRGRGGHTWHSPAADGLYVSALVSPRVPAERRLWLSLATGLAARAAIADETGLPVDIRWPNDLMLSGRKCAGILVESSTAAGDDATLRYAVIGVGINVNQAAFPPELADLATSLRIELGAIVSREALLAAFLRHLDAEIGHLEAGESNLLERFSAASTWVCDAQVSVDEGGGYTGLTCGLDSRGFLLVKDDNGALRTVISGGVRKRT